MNQSRRAAETGIDAQRAAVETMFDSLESAKSVQQSGVTLSKNAVDAYLDGLSMMLPEESIEELEAAVDEQFEAVDEIHEDAWQSFVESLDEAEATYDELTEMQLELVAEGFDAAEEVQATAEETTEEAVESAEDLSQTA
jgi:peptide subunit release factor 1 (eRF1)